MSNGRLDLSAVLFAACLLGSSFGFQENKNEESV